MIKTRLRSGRTPRASKSASVEARCWEFFFWTALIAGAVWVVLNTVIQIRQATWYSDIFSSEEAAELWVWAQAISGIAYTVFLVALGSYVLLWLRVRQSSDSHQ